jgi:hypothetical protein
MKRRSGLSLPPFIKRKNAVRRRPLPELGNEILAYIASWLEQRDNRGVCTRLNRQWHRALKVRHSWPKHVKMPWHVMEATNALLCTWLKHLHLTSLPLMYNSKSRTMPMPNVTVFKYEMHQYGEDLHHQQLETLLVNMPNIVALHLQHATYLTREKSAQSFPSIRHLFLHSNKNSIIYFDMSFLCRAFPNLEFLWTDGVILQKNWWMRNTDFTDFWPTKLQSIRLQDGVFAWLEDLTFIPVQRLNITIGDIMMYTFHLQQLIHLVKERKVGQLSLCNVKCNTGSLIWKMTMDQLIAVCKTEGVSFNKNLIAV